MAQETETAPAGRTSESRGPAPAGATDNAAQSSPPKPEGSRARPAETLSSSLSSSLTMAAFVAGAFSLAVSAVLVANYLRTDASDPLNSAEFIALKKKLIERPRDEGVKRRIRELDLQLRKRFFRRQGLSATGGYLILAGVVILFAGLKLAAEIRKGPPTPQRVEDRIKESHAASRARLSVAALGVLLGGAALLLAVGLGSVLTRESVSKRDPSEPPAVAPYPSLEEIRQNWPYFRGPDGMGVSVCTDAPTSWNGNTGEGILWKTAVPLKGASSPVVWSDRLFLTGASATTREVYCFDATSGELVWQRRVENIPGGDLPSGEVWDDKTYASSTPATDGRRVYAVYANGDLASFDLEGNPVWSRGLGPIRNGYGHASSLAMYCGSLLVQLDQVRPEEGPSRSKLIALDAATGRMLWEAAERPVPESWSTPVVISAPTGDQIVTCANPWVISYDPATGNEIWRVKCLDGDVVPSAVYAGGLVFAMMEIAELTAIRPDGTGDVTESHVVWTTDEDLSSIPSPVSDGEHLFVLSSVGYMTCWDIQSGKRLWDQDLELAFQASPVLVGDRIYAMSDEGTGVVMKASSKYEEIARPELGEYVSASPAFVSRGGDGRIYIRGEEHLFCIGGGGRGSPPAGEAGAPTAEGGGQ